jgi:Icc-related predicted phosphoesterase
MYRSDFLVLGGDITGKVVIPVVRQADGTFECEFLGTAHRFRDADDAAAFEKIIARTGAYPYWTDVDALAELRQSGRWADEAERVALDLMLERVERWIRLAEERLGGTGAKVFMGAGNDDPFEVDEILASSDFVIHHDNRVVEIDEHHEMLGLGYANMTPWRCPRDVPDEELGARLERLIGEVDTIETSIFCVHVPPVDSQLDTCPMLDDSVYPPAVVQRGGEPVLYGAGSSAVRTAIETHQPLVGLHGHIHESRGVAEIGRTKLFNPGSEYSEGVLRGVIVNLTEDGVLSYQLTSG